MNIPFSYKAFAVVACALIGAFLIFLQVNPRQKQEAGRAERNKLTTQQWHILYGGGTETPFTSDLLHEKRPGTYVTADCGEPVFRSEQKFDSGTGWPSFWAPIRTSSVTFVKDTGLLEERVEVRSTCGEHLGHVFPDGPPPTGQRYCINGLALRFIPDAPTSTSPAL